MRNYKIFSIVLFMVICTCTFASTKTYPFDVRKAGQGEKAIIFIPGFASSGDVWQETRSQYENQYTCYTLTMAGFAGIEPQNDPTFTNWENAIAAYIMENNIHKPIIIGHSMGGAMALAIASDFPDLVDKIIVIDALPCLQAVSNPRFKSTDEHDCSTIVGQLTALTDDEFYNMQKIGVSRLLLDSARQEEVLKWSIESDRKTFATMYCNFWNTDLREKIKSIKCPTLILLESYFANLKPTMEEQYKNLKNSNLQYANKGLHFIMYDDKEWYFTQLNNFITRK